jgi:hypothetical protein
LLYLWGEKRPGREAENTLLSSADFKDASSYISTLPTHVHGVVFSENTGKTLPLSQHAFQCL